MKKYIADAVTGLRIICALLMLLPPVLSFWFYVLYCTCGLSDMIDGTIARSTGSVSELGKRLDTAADFVFFVSAFVKLMPVLDMPRWLWVWIIIIAALKLISAALGFILRKKLTAEHTIMNKITGALLFVLPITLCLVELKYIGAIICSFAMLSAADECRRVVIGKIHNQ